MSLEGKIALVTGASRGIGQAISKRLFEDGATLVLTSRSLEPIRRVAQELDPSGQRVLALSCDVSDSKQVSQMMEASLQKFQKIDILVNNAGLTKDNLLVRMSE